MKAKIKKGQVSIEVLSFSAIFIIAFFIIYSFINSFGQQEIKNSYYVVTSQIAQRFASTLTTAYSIGEGFKYEVNLPQRIGTAQYNISLIQENNQTTIFVSLPYGNESITAVTKVNFIVRCNSTGSASSAGKCSGTNIININAQSFNISTIYNQSSRQKEVVIE
jgi:hypothetical protein